MINLKVKCTLCGKEDVDEDIVREVAEIVRQHKVKAEHYLHFLNVMSGKCLDSDEHSFIFDETFLKEMGELTTKFKNDLAEVDKLYSINDKLTKELKELEIQTKELSTKITSNKERINNLFDNTHNYDKELIKSTGCDDVHIWY